MKAEKTTYGLFILIILISVFIGKEAVIEKNANSYEASYLADSFQAQPIQKNMPLLVNDTTKVYRCGQSKIYHPTTRHASFKRCKSKIYVLTVKQAKQLGMRHCKCRG